MQKLPKNSGGQLAEDDSVVDGDAIFIVRNIKTDALKTQISELSSALSTLTTSFNTFKSSNRYVVETYNSGYSWYRIYNDGWIEQGGYTNVTANGTATTFLKTMANTNYKIDACCLYDGARYATTKTRTTTGCTWYTGDDSSFNASPLTWEVKGYKA